MTKQKVHWCLRDFVSNVKVHSRAFKNLQKTYDDPYLQPHYHSIYITDSMSMADWHFEQERLFTKPHAERIDVHISSCGGNMVGAIRFAEALYAHPAEKITRAYEQASSAAFFMFLLGNTRLADPRCLLLHHDSQPKPSVRWQQLLMFIGDVQGVKKRTTELFRQSGNSSLPMGASTALAYGIATKLERLGRFRPCTATIERRRRYDAVWQDIQETEKQTPKKPKKQPPAPRRRSAPTGRPDRAAIRREILAQIPRKLHAGFAKYLDTEIDAVIAFRQNLALGYQGEMVGMAPYYFPPDWTH